MQSFQCVKHAREDVEVSGGADVAFVWRKTKQNDCQPNLFAWRGSQSVPPTQATGKSVASVCESDGLVTACWDAAVDERLCGAVDLGYRDLHSGLHRVQARRRIRPRFNRLRVEAHRGSIR